MESPGTGTAGFGVDGIAGYREHLSPGDIYIQRMIKCPLFYVNSTKKFPFLRPTWENKSILANLYLRNI